MDFNRLLENKTAIITSGAHGMGFAIAKIFAQHGCTVAINGRRDSGEESAEYLRRYTPGSFFVKTDMSDQGEVEAFCDEALKRLGHIDIIVNNVGINDRELSHEISESKYEYIQNVNIRSLITIEKKLVPQMIKRGQGSIVNISSIHSVSSFPGMGSYAVSKGGMNALNRVMATELGQYGIRTNVICPGGVFTTYSSADYHVMTPEQKKKDTMEGQIWEPLYGPGHAEDIANAALYFASDLSSYVTGMHMLVDGGADAQAHSTEYMLPDDYDELIGEYAMSFLCEEDFFEEIRKGLR